MGMRAGCVLPFSACGCLSPAPPLRAGCVLPSLCLRLSVPCTPLHVSPFRLPLKVPPSLSLSLALMLSHLAAAQCGPVPTSGCLSPLRCLYIPQMRESHWAAETLDKEGLSESVRSCESCPGVGP